MSKMFSKIKNSMNKEFLRVYVGFTLAVASLVPASAQDKPFNTGDMFGKDVADKSFIEQMKWTIYTLMQVALVLAMIGLVVYCVWGLVGALRGAARSGEWSDFFMHIVGYIIGIVAAVVFAGLGTTWLESIKVDG